MFFARVKDVTVKDGNLCLLVSSEAGLLSYRHASTTDISGLVSGLIQYLSDLWNSGEFQGENCVFKETKYHRERIPKTPQGPVMAGLNEQTCPRDHETFMSD